MRRPSALILAALAIGGCSTAPTETRVPPPTSSPSATRVLPTATTTAAPSVTPPDCRAQPGTFVVDEYLDADLPRSIPYRVYLPPCYDEANHEPLPVLLMLHGLLATDQQWQDLGIGAKADELIAAGEAPPFLIVLPWERRGLEFESALVEHLLPYIQKAYHGATSRGLVAVGGLSRGGGWALRIGLKHPDVFGEVGLHSPAVLSPDLYYVGAWVAAIPPANRPRLWVDIGDHDSLRSSVFDLTALLDELGYPYVWTFGPGDHTPNYWSGNLEAYLRWYSEGWRGTSIPETQTAPGAGS